MQKKISADMLKNAVDKTGKKKPTKKKKKKKFFGSSQFIDVVKRRNDMLNDTANDL